MTLDKVKQLISKQLNLSIDKISDESKLIEDLGADSLDMVEMMMTLEDEFGLSITDEQAVTLKTVKDIVEFIDKN